jgi:amino acid permease
MEKEIIINQSFDKKTLNKAAIQILLSSNIMLFFVIIVFFQILNFVSDAQKVASVDIFMLIPLLFIFLVAFAVWYRTKKAINRDYTKNPRYYNNIKFTLTKDFLTIEGKDFQNKTPWENYIKIKEKSKWFLVYTSKNQAQILDKVQLEGITVEELRNFFRTLPPKTRVSLK